MRVRVALADPRLQQHCAIGGLEFGCCLCDSKRLPVATALGSVKPPDFCFCVSGSPTLHTCCRALQRLAETAPLHILRAPSCSLRSGDGGLDRGTDPCRRYAAPALAPPAAYDLAWTNLHGGSFTFGLATDRAHSAVREHSGVRHRISATGCCAAVVEFSRSLPWPQPAWIAMRPEAMTW